MPLIERADILVEQFRPGVMDRLGLGYEEASALNPRLIYCSVTGYGQAGPRAQEAGHDINYQAVTGLLSLSPGSPEAPATPPALVADIAGGAMPAVLNILLALRRRDLTGEGAHLDIAMADAMFTFAWFGLAEGHATGRFPGAAENMLAGGSPRYGLYATRGRPVPRRRRAGGQVLGGLLRGDRAAGAGARPGRRCRSAREPPSPRSSARATARSGASF